MITRGSKYSAVTCLSCLFVCSLLAMSFYLNIAAELPTICVLEPGLLQGLFSFHSINPRCVLCMMGKAVGSSFPPGDLFRISLGVPFLFSLFKQNWHWQNLNENQNEFVLKSPAVSCHVYLVFSVTLQLLRTSLSRKVINKVLMV